MRFGVKALVAVLGLSFPACGGSLITPGHMPAEWASSATAFKLLPICFASDMTSADNMRHSGVDALDVAVCAVYVLKPVEALGSLRIISQLP
jgi:hypothetical protein